VWGADRGAAIDRMARALAEYHVVGIRTTLPVLARTIAHPDFRAGRLSTGFLDRVLPGLTAGEGPNQSVAIVAAVLAEYERSRRPAAAPPPPDPSLDAWRLALRHRGRPGVRW